MTSRPLRDHSLLDRVARVDAAALSDANKSLRVLPAALRLVSAGTRMAGRAVTADSDDDLLSVLAGLEACGPGDVLVVNANGSANAVAGELFATEAARRGLAGLVVHGMVRDSHALARLTLPVFALGTTPRAGTARKVPSINVPVSLDGIVVTPGDLLVGDSDGIIVATEEEMAAAIDKAESIRLTEEALVLSMGAGASLFERLNFADHVAKVRAGEESALRFLSPPGS
ncbi:RraA family protein [Lentzea sp. NPDC058450]|uniref:RraA family protein n=1 Tax=Lentzea sp. NPDC058450 TaxID=3346505 RepID=UPI003658392C